MIEHACLSNFYEHDQTTILKKSKKIPKYIVQTKQKYKFTKMSKIKVRIINCNL